MTAAGFHQQCKGKGTFVDEATARRHSTKARRWYRCERCGLVHAGRKPATSEGLFDQVEATRGEAAAALAAQFAHADAQLRHELAQIGGQA